MRLISPSIPHGYNWCPSCAVTPAYVEAADLALKALEILERRKWAVMYDYHNKSWSVHSDDGQLTMVAPLEISVQENLAKALVNSDEWIKKEEGKKNDRTAST